VHLTQTRDNGNRRNRRVHLGARLARSCIDSVAGRCIVCNICNNMCASRPPGVVSPLTHSWPAAEPQLRGSRSSHTVYRGTRSSCSKVCPAVPRTKRRIQGTRATFIEWSVDSQIQHVCPCHRACVCERACVRLSVCCACVRVYVCACAGEGERRCVYVHVGIRSVNPVRKHA